MLSADQRIVGSEDENEPMLVTQTIPDILASNFSPQPSGADPGFFKEGVVIMGGEGKSP